MSDDKFDLGFTTESMFAAMKAREEVYQRIATAKRRQERLEWLLRTNLAIFSLALAYLLLSALGVLP
jgi:hypothetical protein